MNERVQTKDRVGKRTESKNPKIRLVCYVRDIGAATACSKG